MWQLRACINMSPIATRDFATSSQSQLHIFLQLKEIIAVPLYPPYKITQLYKGKEQSLWLHQKFRDPRNKTAVTPQAWKWEVQAVTSFIPRRLPFYTICLFANK
jgi:hypothetical protein